MNKYVELIKAEIERRIAGNSDARARALLEILTFINSLPEDEPSGSSEIPNTHEQKEDEK